MPNIKVVLIPSDKTKPVQEVDYDQSDYTNLTALIFNGERTGTFQRFALDDRDGNEVTLWHDDDGLARLDSEELRDIVNLRAMELVAHIANKDVGEIVPLIGDYVITGGADDEGDSLPAPAWVKDHEFTWHNKFEVRSTEA